MATIVLIMPTLMQGGAERVMSILANEWVKQNHRVFLLILVNNVIFYDLDERVECVFLGQEKSKNLIHKFINRFQLLFRLRNFVRKKKPDFALSFLDKYNVFVIFSTLFLNTKIFVSDRSNPLFKGSVVTEILKKIFYRFSSGIIAQTSLAKEVIGKKTKHENIKIIYNPLFVSINKEEVQREKIILTVGRMVEEKGQHYLIDVMTKIKSPDWKLVILGDGPMRQKIEDKITAYDLHSRIELKGQTKKIRKWLYKSSIFVFPSISEGFPNALVEAMGAGLPCVSFNCNAGPADIIKDGENGFLIPVGNVNLMSTKVNDLINDENLRIRIGENAKKINETLNAEKIANDYFDFCMN